MLIKNVYYILFSFILILSLDLTNTMLSYGIFLIIMFVFLLERLFINEVYKIDYISIIPLSLVLVWLYGFTLGILNDNITIYIIRNFAGLLMYLLYFILINNNFTINSIIRFVLYISLINVLIGLFYGIYEYSNGAGSRLIFFGNMTTYFIPFTWGFFNIFAPIHIKEKTDNVFILSFFNSLLILVLSILVISFSFSKGFMLGLLVLTFSLVILLYKKDMNSHKINFKLMYLFLFMILSFFVMQYYNIIDLISLIFDAKEESNNLRYHQFFTLVNDFSLFGKGLGALVSNNNSVNTYGFELVYINVIHKFGIVSIIIFISFFYTLYMIVSMLKRKEDTFVLLVSLSCLIYLIPSLGNPMLFAPINVLLHVFVLSIIYKLDKREKKYV